MATKPLTVTFDTNTWDRVARPARFPKDPARPDFLKINEYLVAGKLRGFFSETLITIEGIQRADRAAVLGSTSLRTNIEEIQDESSTHTSRVHIVVNLNRKPLHREQSARIQAAVDIGMRILRAPTRIGLARVSDPTGTLFHTDESEALLAQRLDRTVQVLREIEGRGVGLEQVKSLAKELARRDNVNELWIRSLARAQNIHEQGQLSRAVAEWADADSVATHVGHRFDLFCTEDQGGSAGGPSVLDATNREWLARSHGVEFVTLSELGKRLVDP